MMIKLILLSLLCTAFVNAVYTSEVGICKNDDGVDYDYRTFVNGPLVIQSCLDQCDADATCTGVVVEEAYSSFSDSTAWCELFSYPATSPTVGNGNTDYHCQVKGGAVDCVGAWGFCLNSEQTYYVSTPDEHGGNACEAEDGDTQACITVCNDDSAVDITGGDCQYQLDGQQCTAEGGEGYWYDGYSNGPIEQYVSYNGFVPLLCPQCGCVDTPVDCVASWSSCSNDATCQQTYSVTTADHGAGVACEAANGATRACVDDSGCPITPVGGEDCKALDEAGCAAQPDSCHAKTRGGKFRNCKPKRCKPMNESECETAVHCEKKLGRRGDYKKCRRID